MILKITTSNIVLKMALVFLLFSLHINAQPYKILNNGQRRIGNGAENSINSSGNMQQPFYFNSSSSTWRQLTFSNYPLDIRWGVGGDGTNNWNINGIMEDNPIVSNPVYDYTGFTTTNMVTGDGYGVIKFSGNITINSQLFLLENTYTLLQPDGFFRVKVKITNLSGSTASNVRLWVGTRDDWVGNSDGPTKERGNLVDGVFTSIPTTATQSKAIKVSSGTEAILLFSNSPRAYTTINDCCSFTNATNQDPATNDITRTGDGSYATYARFNDLLNGQSDELDWYYAAGTLTEIAEIIRKVAEAAGAVSNVSYTSADYSYSASQSGTTSYVLVPAGSTVPTDVQIEAGLSYPGGTVISSSSIPSVANVAHIYNFTGLTYNSNYTIYTVTKYNDGVSNVFTSVQTTNFSTLPNDVPVGSAIANQTTCINSSLSGISLTITDAYPGNNTFTVTGSSSNTSLVPNGNIVITGSGNSRSIAITPNTGISGTSTITISMTDSLGATGTQTFNVTFNDTELPTITAPAAINTITNTACTATGIVLGNPTTADNCGVASVTNNAPTVFPKGVTTVTWTVTDLGGNTKTATQTVTVTDNVNPTITAPATVISTACAPTAIALGTPVTADNCSVASVTNNAPAIFPLGDTTVTWTVTDSSGNTATATQLVSVGDTVFPVVKTKNATVYLNNFGQAIVTPAMIDNGTTDNCDFSLIVSPNNFVCGNVGVNNVILIATDASGNQTIRPALVTVVDNTPPTITAPSAVSAIANASCGATGVVLGTPTTSDNCFIDTPAVNNAPSSFPLGATTVTWTVTDRNGNSNTATQIVTVLDNQNPTIATLAATSVNADAGVCTYASSQLTEPSAADNCSVTVTVSPASLSLGSNVVTWIATDGSGNTATSTQTVNVVDNQNPTIIAPLDLIVSTNASCNATGLNLGIPTTADNCSVASVTNDALTTFPLGDTTVTWTVTDGSGNTSTATQTVTVKDTTSPTITAPAAVTANANTDGVAIGVDLGTPTTDDNCSVDSVTNDAPESFLIGNTTVTWTVTDGSGNSTTATQIVTVLDEINPTITCVENINMNNDAGECGAIVNYTLPTFSDNSNSVELTQTAGLAYGSSFPIGTTTNTFLATDGSGNTSTCSFDVIVTDNEKPNVATQNITVELDSNGQANITTAMINSGSTDNCAIDSYSLDITSFNCSNLGEVEVTLTVNDVNGNSSSNTAIVTVVDILEPTIATLSAISVNADLGACTYASSQLKAPVAADNCSVASVIASPASLVLGSNTVTWTATDGSGNTQISTQTVTVVDAQIPTIATLNPISVNADSGVCTYVSSQLTKPTAADNCSVASVVATPASLALGENTVTWTVTDGSGLTETSIQTVTVVDAQNPTIATLPAISVNADSGVCTYESSQLTAPTAADNCSVATVVASPASLILGSNTVTWTVTDGSGLTATSTQTVTVIDIQKPTITPLDVVVSANASCNATGVDLGTPTTTDNCSVASVTNDAPTTFPLGDTTVTWTVTDGSGNTASATQTITVEDTTLPTITAPADVTGNVNASCGATGVVLGNAVTADNCSVASVTNDAPAIFPLGETIVTWTVTDGSGNIATATQLVTMGDTIFPVVKAKNATVYLNSLGQAIILPSMIDNGTTDNCEFTLTVSPNNLVCANVGQNNVLLIATDASGNQSFKPATITLVDNLAPMITAPSNVSATANASCSATGIVLGSPMTSDNCYVDTVVNNAPTTFPIGVTTVVWTVTDRSGNTATANQTVTVTESVLPIVKTKDITIQLDASGNATITAADIDNESSDNCGISTMTLSQDTFTISDIGFKTITLTVTDNSGNTSSATAQVTVGGTLSTIAQKNNTFTIYPIPFDSYINITLPNSYTEDVIYVQIYDLSGRIVYNQKHAVENHNVIISDLKRNSDGSYYINLLDGNQNVIQSKHILKKSEY